MTVGIEAMLSRQAVDSQHFSRAPLSSTFVGSNRCTRQPVSNVQVGHRKLMRRLGGQSQLEVSNAGSIRLLRGALPACCTPMFFRVADSMCNRLAVTYSGSVVTCPHIRSKAKRSGACRGCENPPGCSL